MLLYFIYPMVAEHTVFNVIRYITFRTFGAAITAVVLSMFLGPWFISWLQRKQIGQEIRDDGPKSHLSKKGTPTMGGTLILVAIFISVLIWGDLTNKYVWIATGTTLFFGVVGFVDDYLKVFKKNPKGLKARQKFISQVLIAFLFCYLLYIFRDGPPVLKFPFLKDVALNLGWGFIPFAMFIVVGSSNAVNLTDGLDGLAVGPTMTTASTFVVLAYCAGHAEFAEYLQIPFIQGAGELCIFLASMAAACLGFLWFNTYPAQVFMGDVGSLALGAGLGITAIVTKNEILLALCGGIFVLEALSVMAQVISYKTTGKRVFKMAPIHHHFELKGWAEPKVIVRFWIISILLALATLSTLKLR